MTASSPSSAHSRTTALGPAGRPPSNVRPTEIGPLGPRVLVSRGRNRYPQRFPIPQESSIMPAPHRSLIARAVAIACRRRRRHRPLDRRRAPAAARRSGRPSIGLRLPTRASGREPAGRPTAVFTVTQERERQIDDQLLDRARHRDQPSSTSSARSGMIRFAGHEAHADRRRHVISDALDEARRDLLPRALRGDGGRHRRRRGDGHDRRQRRAADPCRSATRCSCRRVRRATRRSRRST